MRGSFTRPPIVLRTSRCKLLAIVVPASAAVALLGLDLLFRPWDWGAWIFLPLFGVVDVVCWHVLARPFEVTFDRDGITSRRGGAVVEHWDWQQIGQVRYTPILPDTNFMVWKTKDGPVEEESLPGFLEPSDAALARMIDIGKRRWGRTRRGGIK